MNEPRADEHPEHHLIAERKQKLAQWRKEEAAFPNDFRVNGRSDRLHSQFAAMTAEALAAVTEVWAVAGRMMLRRIMGKASFVTLQDVGGRIQLYITRDAVGETVYQAFKHWDLGDIIAATGRIFRTQAGELSIKVESLRLLTKALRPLPDKFHGIADQELKYRQRYVDLMVNAETRKVFQIRSQVIAAIREFLLKRDYLEVETPMMHVIPGGAAARPFVTHHNALDMQLYLRIAPELYLKRLVVGGFERVFEINRNFRNEGLSTRHNPEFTMLEFYQAYADYRDLMELTEQLLEFLSLRILGSTQVPYAEETYSFAAPFCRMSMHEAVLLYHPHWSMVQLRQREVLVDRVRHLGVEVQDSWGLGKLLTVIFEECVEQKLRQPTFITGYPAEVSPLARRSDADPQLTDRFEFFIGGREIANGFSELNDPEDQAERFKEQVREKEAGDVEAMHYDADFIRALEYGLPPTAGEGIGIDRLVMLLTNVPSIRDVILFPHLRAESLD